MSRAEEEFRDAIAAAGIQPPPEVIADGRIHRFSSSARRGDDAGWYVLHLDGVPIGCFGCWRMGFDQVWCAKHKREMTVAERAAMAQRIQTMKRQRESDKRRRQAEAALAALVRWAAATPADYSHPYLQCKNVRGHALRREGALLLMPVRDTAGNLHSLQEIHRDGFKHFLTGGRKKGCYHAIGRLGRVLVICEGYATGATIHEQTGYAVAVAFDAGNLKSVALALRAKYPDIIIVIAADDDWKVEGNPGLTKAREAAAAVGGLLAVPDFTGLPRGFKDTDWNDWARLRREAAALEVSA